MKLSLNWLNDYVDLSDVPVPELVDRLTLAVCEVEGVAETFAHLDQIHVAWIESLEKHPDADRLNVCRVRDGKHTHQIVCGAPNVRAGMFAPLAVVGARLPRPEAEGEFLEIKPAKLRGVASNGMLCSPGELGLTPLTGEVDGLIDLDSLPGNTAGKLKHGTPLTELLPLRDTVLDIDNKSITHRPDLWCHFGFAREIAGLYGKKLIFDPLSKRAKRQPGTDAKLPSKKIVIETGAAKAYYGRSLAGVQIGPAPLYMQARLINVGQRPINNVVDASNYVMLELGQPNHTFDAKTLKSDTVTVALANAAARPVGGKTSAKDKTKSQTGGASAFKRKSFTTLDGQAREVPENTILILDGPAGAHATPVALGGIMGGETSGVGDATTELFLESATFPRERIRPAIARLGLRTDSAQRFEKGQDPAKAKPALDRLAELIAESCPELRQGKTTGASPEKEQRNKITVPLSFLRARLGFDVTEKLVMDILTRLNFDVLVKGGKKNRAAGDESRATKEKRRRSIRRRRRISDYPRRPIAPSTISASPRTSSKNWAACTATTTWSPGRPWRKSSRRRPIENAGSAIRSSGIWRRRAVIAKPSDIRSLRFRTTSVSTTERATTPGWNPMSSARGL
jgi:phenylalanyl-tRNA synthetase beta chain